MFPMLEVRRSIANISRGFKAQVLGGITALIARNTATPLGKQASTASTHDCYYTITKSYPRWWGGGVWRVAP